MHSLSLAIMYIANVDGKLSASSWLLPLLLLSCWHGASLLFFWATALLMLTGALLPFGVMQVWVTKIYYHQWWRQVWLVRIFVNKHLSTLQVTLLPRQHQWPKSASILLRSDSHMTWWATQRLYQRLLEYQTGWYTRAITERQMSKMTIDFESTESISRHLGINNPSSTQTQQQPVILLVTSGIATEDDDRVIIFSHCAATWTRKPNY